MGLSGGDPLQRGRHRVPRRRAMRLDQPESEVGKLNVGRPTPSRFASLQRYALASRLQRSCRRQQLLVGREFVDAGQAFLGAFNVGPAHNAVPVYKELAGELDLMPLELCGLALRHLETVQPADGVASLVVGHLDFQLARQLPIGTPDRLHKFGRDSSVRYAVGAVGEQVGVSANGATNRAVPEEKTGAFGLRGDDPQCPDAYRLKPLCSGS